MNEQLIIDIVYFIVYYIIPVFYAHFYFTVCLTPKNKTCKLLMLTAFPVANIILSSTTEEINGMVRWVLIVALTFAPALFLVKEPKRYGIFTVSFLEIIMMTADIPYSSFFLETLGYFPSKIETKTWVSVFFSLGFVILYIILTIPFSLLMRSKVKKIHDKSMGLFMLFPLGQAFFLAACSYPTWTGDFQVFNNAFTVIAFIISIISDFFLFYALRENSKLEELKIQLLEMEHSLEMQYQYYTNLAEKQVEVSEYRHDINNLVSTVESLVEKNISVSEGIALARDMKKKSVSMLMPSFCKNPIVNAVLWHKKKEAESAGISFDISIDKDEDFPIDRMDVCSLFANLIDNALKEAKKIPDSRVTVRAYRNIGCMFFEITNPHIGEIKTKAAKSSRKKDNHGRGLQIVKRIAEKYNGEFILFSENSRAIAKVCIKI